MIKKCFFGSLIFLMLPFSGYAAPDAAPLNKIVAVVNGDVITQSELEKRIIIISHLPRKNSDAPEAPALRKQALDSLINSLLQRQLAQRNGIQIKEAEIDSAISNIAKNNQLSVEQLKQSLLEREGLTFKEYREQIREQMLTSRIQHIVLGKEISINKEDIEKALRNPPKMNDGAVTRYHVADILIETPDNASPNQIKTITNVAAQMAAKLKQNIDIDKLVKEYNVAPNRISTQDLGWRTVDELPTLFTKEISAMKPGQIAGPLKAPNGLHLIKLLETQGSQPQLANFTKEQAEEFVYRQKLEEKLKPWFKELRETAYIKVFN